MIYLYDLQVFCRADIDSTKQEILSSLPTSREKLDRELCDASIAKVGVTIFFFLLTMFLCSIISYLILQFVLTFSRQLSTIICCLCMNLVVMYTGEMT